MRVHATAKGRKVLVVEDQMPIVLVIEDVLLDLGVEVIGPASRLEVAIRLARELAIDAAILDVNIRGGNSYPVADILERRRIPFIFYSGYSDWAIEERHRHRPRLTKPCNPNELKELVLEVLDAPAGT